MPTECLERIVYHASQDHRVLSTLMQVNSTLFRIATPYLYREPFRFKFGDEFQLDWDTETWTRHLREVRHAKLLLLYLRCTETVQALLLPTPTTLFAVGKGKCKGKGSRLADSTVQLNKYLGQTTIAATTTPSSSSSSTTTLSQGQRQQGSVSAHVTLPSDAEGGSHNSLPSATPIERIPPLLQKLLASDTANEGIPAIITSAAAAVSLLSPHSQPPSSLSTRRMSLPIFGSTKGVDFIGGSLCSAPKQPQRLVHTVNYLDYVEHLDLDMFLAKSIQVLLSTSLTSSTGFKGDSRMASLPPPPPSSRAAHYLSRGNHCTAERAFAERVLFRSTAQHITTLSISVGAFARLQRELMEPIVETWSSAASSREALFKSSTSLSAAVAPVATVTASKATTAKNSAGIKTGAPLSQLSHLNISGLHAELKPKVMRAIRWFLRRHVTVCPGVLKVVTFEGPGDTIVNRRRQRNRNVIGVEPVQPGVVHFNNQHDDDDDDTADEVEEEEYGPEAATTAAGAAEILFVDGTGHINNVYNTATAAAAADAFPADFHSQYYLLSRNPDQSCDLDFMGVLQELEGQLEELDLSRWSWSVITQQALDMIPTGQLLTLRFHPRTRIQSPHGSSLLRNCPMLKHLEIHSFDPQMLNLDDGGISNAASSTSPNSTSLTPPSLRALSLAGSVQNVLPAVSDAIRTTGKSLDTIDLAAHLDGFLSTEETLRLMDWGTSVSSSTIPCLTTLRLHGHLALSFDAPLLLELCPTLRRFGLTIKSYTSSSFIRAELARVLPRFMVTWDGQSADGGFAAGSTTEPKQKFLLKDLELEGPWILTDLDLDQIAEQIEGLVDLNLVGCRFYPMARCLGTDETLTPEECSPVVRLVERVQGTLRTLRIHRRGLENRPRRDSTDYCSITSATTTSATSNSHLPTTESSTSEPILAFKKRFPNVTLLIREKQHEHSFVLAPSPETLRRIHHHHHSHSQGHNQYQYPWLPSNRQNNTLPISFSEAFLLGQPSSPTMLHEFSGQSSMWRRARSAVPFLSAFRRHKTYPPNGFENGQIRSWGGSIGFGIGGDSGGGSGSTEGWRKRLSSRFFRG
ncbi:hypothetical protein BGZ58_001513 [Dissophora ornata]|nr:hypothetical protein BGZ58_001513 [Dissophora ornata]